MCGEKTNIVLLNLLNLKYHQKKKHCLYKLRNFLLKPHKLGNSPAEGEMGGRNSIRMVMAGETARLTEQESLPAFLWYDRKYHHTASVKDQRHGTLTHIHIRAQPPSPGTCFPSQYPFRHDESPNHTMSRSFSTFQLPILEIPKEVALRAESQLTLVSPHLIITTTTCLM